MSAPSGSSNIPIVGCLVGAGAGGSAACGEMIPNTGVEIGIYVVVASVIMGLGLVMIAVASRKKVVRTAPVVDPDYDPLFNSTHTYKANVYTNEEVQ